MNITNMDASYTITATFTREKINEAQIEMEPFMGLHPNDRSVPDAVFDIVQALMTDTIRVS